MPLNACLETTEFLHVLLCILRGLFIKKDISIHLIRAERYGSTSIRTVQWCLLFKSFMRHIDYLRNFIARMHSQIYLAQHFQKHMGWRIGRYNLLQWNQTDRWWAHNCRLFSDINSKNTLWNTKTYGKHSLYTTVTSVAIIQTGNQLWIYFRLP